MAKPTTQEEETLFEAEVLRVCRAVFAKDRPFQGSGYIDARERDGIFVGEESIAVVEATVSRGAAKAKQDGEKLKQACAQLTREFPYRGVKGYFVTLEEPTADQRATIAKLNSREVVALSFSQLRALLIDSREYLSARAAYAFGSARNPGTGSATDLGEYVEIGLSSVNARVGSPQTVPDIAASMANGSVIVLTGDFGAGKSMTIRQVHQRLAANHYREKTNRFPVTLNLRDHQGQRDTDEALRRHCARIGFDSPSRLVRAWRAGEVDLLLDGFDEIATTGWLGQANDLRQIRRRSVELIRKFVEEAPPGTGLLIGGRRHLFDTLEEMVQALGLIRRSPVILATDDFTESQLSAFLKERGWDTALPAWLPPRPLLLGYLAAAGVLGALASDSAKHHIDAAAGWDLLLDRIAERESTMEVGVDGVQVRRVLERIATVARTRREGLGPIRQDDFSQAFQEVCGYPPDEGSYVLLQRMPGLGVTDPTDGSRYFIDEALADAARAGDVVREIGRLEGSGHLQSLHGSIAPMASTGVSVAAYVLAQATQTTTGNQAVSVAARSQSRGASDALVLDMVRVGLLLGAESVPPLSFAGLQLSALAFLDSDLDLSSLHFSDSVIDTLDLSEYDGTFSLPSFSRCLFGTVSGVGSASALPIEQFDACEFGAFDAASRTTRGLLAALGLSQRQRVALTILKKVYLQSGVGRVSSALVRGLDGNLRSLVAPLCDELVAEGLIIRGRIGSRTIYYPVRGSTARVRRMVEQGASSSDALLASLK